jgi:hypothetical protein
VTLNVTRKARDRTYQRSPVGTLPAYHLVRHSRRTLGSHIMNTIPKSLHTVTVLVKMAQHFCALNLQRFPEGDRNAAHYVTDVCNLLGYADTPDTYELANKARAILAKSVQS